MDSQKKLFSCKEALFFRNEFREARATALKDAEGYQQILFVLERLGAYLLEQEYTGKLCLKKKRPEKKRLEKRVAPTMSQFQCHIITLVKRYHCFQGEPPDHIAFDSLYDMVRQARNDALHQGAVARNLTSHSVQLSLMLEDALMSASESKKIEDYMVRNPVCAYTWQPISFVRQMMLENSFSYIPVCMKEKGTENKAWHIITDYDIAKYLRPANSADNKECLRERLAKSIEDASKMMDLKKACTACRNKTVQDVLGYTKGKPILVVKQDTCNEKQDTCDDLLGIATAFDLM